MAFVAEGTSLIRALRQTRREAREAERGLVEHVRISDDPTVKPVASEDSAAVVGIVIAFAGIGLHQLTGNSVYDAVASFAIGALLTYVAFVLARDNRGLLIGEAAAPRLRRQLAERLADYPEVSAVVELLTMRMGTDRVLVAARIDLAPHVDSERIEEVSTRIEKDLHERWPEVDQVFLDATPAAGSR